MFQEIDGREFYLTSYGERLPRYADAETIAKARNMNNGTSAIMEGSFRLKGWKDGEFCFAVNRSTAIYRDNGRGQYEIALGLPLPLNGGNGF